MRPDSRASSCLAVIASLLLLAGCQPPAGASADDALTHIEGLGSLSFPNSGAPEAQDPFLRGVLLLHSFEYDRAAEAFRAAQEADPDFALAYWGEALTYNHPLWRQRDRDAALEALGRLAASPEERIASAPTERERGYMEAVETLYAEGDKEDRDRAYMEAMERLHRAHPEDHEAQALYALSILGSGNGSRDFATYMRAAATAQPVFLANPNHPGAAHYLIHSFDDPVHAPLGLPAARVYADVAPGASHAQHMTTHIFVALGMWEAVVEGNTRARDTQDGQFAAAGERANVCGHYSSWLQYGHLQLGQTAEAEALMDRCHARMSEDPRTSEWGYFVSMRARQIIDSEDWPLAERWTAEAPEGGRTLAYEFTNAFASLRHGDTAPARALLRDAEPESGFDGLHVDELRGLVAIADGRADAGVDILRAAAEAEDSMPFEFGPPRVLKPTYELLGETLLEVGRAAEARAAFRRANERTPGRALAVRGLESASEASMASGG